MEDEAQDGWIVKSLSGLRMKLKKEPVFLVLPEHQKLNKMLGKDPSHQPCNPVL